MEYEFETLIPELERTKALPDDIDNLRNMIRKAKVLAQTYTKKVIQSKATNYNNPFNLFRISIITKKLHRIHGEIAKASDELSRSAELARESSPENQTPRGGDVTQPDQSIPSYLKRCMHYFVLFSPEFKVPARRLIALWVAEDLVYSKKPDNQSVEQIAKRYLDELIEHKVIHVKRNSSNKVKTCWIDADRRNALLKEAKKAKFLKDMDGIRRLVDHNGKDDASFIEIDGDPNISALARNYRDVISFLSFDTREGSKPGEDIGDFIRKCISAGSFIWLNVLDLENVFRPKLPSALGKIISLKYLGLRWTLLEQLPESVNKLLNLEVLDVKHTYLSVLPRYIWKMKYLRHLYLSESYRTRFPNPPSNVTLNALQTLWGAFVDAETCVEGGLDRLLNIRKLGLSCRTRGSKGAEMSQKLKAIDRWISNLKHLESLRLKSRDEDGYPLDLHLTSLEGNKSLSTVYLVGKLDPSVICELPVSLTDITLSGSALDLDPMGFLGRLPNLTILRLLGQSVVCSKMHCHRRSFQKLKVLWLWKLQSLEEFEADEEGSLPSLEELEIRSCGNLKKLPDRLVKIKKLEVRLTSMEQRFLLRERVKYAHIQLVSEDQVILKNTIPTRENKLKFE